MIPFYLFYLFYPFYLFYLFYLTIPYVLDHYARAFCAR
jgi:hypothetical protein